MQPWTSRKAGFTLIELSLVLALLAVVLFLTAAHARFLNRLVVRAELERLYATCYYLQRCAMAQGKPYKIVFDMHAHSYRYNDCSYTLSSSVRFGCLPNTHGPPSKPTNTIAKPVTFKGNSLTFHPDGIVQSGTIYLTDAQHTCMYALSCAVSQVSYLRKYQYTNAWELL